IRQAICIASPSHMAACSGSRRIALGRCLPNTTGSPTASRFTETAAFLTLTPRLTLGALSLVGGLDLTRLAIGLFGFSEIMAMARQPVSKLRIIPPPRTFLGFLPNQEETRRSVAPVARGTVLGFLVGVLPGGGAMLASFLSYAVERKVSSHPEEFGKGAVEGLAGPETANNAGTAGALLPLLCMGLPANAVSAVLLTAFMVHGGAPGPAHR